jgi:energy-coupling factor transporter ATP-binding protein EcfA2
MDNSFKLPIEYISDTKINDIVRKDLEICNDTSNNLYKLILKNDSILMDQWTSTYTTDKKFLKDTQKCIKNYRSQDYNCDDFIHAYHTFNSETSFVDKYQYIGIDKLRFLNHSPVFLHCLGIYNLASPVFSLCTPLFLLIIPFVLLKAKGINITIGSYIESLKKLMMGTSVCQLLFNFGSIGSQQRVSSIISFIVYVLQVYNNIISCISFYKNINVVYDFLKKYQQHLIETTKVIDTINSQLSHYSSYIPFVQNMINEQVKINKWIGRLNKIIDTTSTPVKISQLGLLMNLYYELFMLAECNQMYFYSVYINQFNRDMMGLHSFVRNKKLNKCKFGSETKIKKMYYLAHINDKPILNDISLKRNLLVTGPNASGKTTILKSLLLNVLLSQQIGYGCYKGAMIQCYDIFHSYLNIPDTSGRDSLFQAEARRCKDILESIHDQQDKKHLCIFDEIYSGTNPNDAILCAQIYLKGMNQFKKCMDYMITTHYIQLCESFDKNDKVNNMKMDVEVNDDKIKYLYTMKNGISYINGGKHILKEMNYPDYLFNI